MFKIKEFKIETNFLIVIILVTAIFFSFVLFLNSYTEGGKDLEKMYKVGEIIIFIGKGSLWAFCFLMLSPLIIYLFFADKKIEIKGKSKILGVTSMIWDIFSNIVSIIFIMKEISKGKDINYLALTIWMLLYLGTSLFFFIQYLDTKEKNKNISNTEENKNE